ncbi:hypothetical protein chiPu_0016539 [Chiloscyllium punctatum]|uniref:Peptidase M12B domain-containing protein n=1 Tax=Chiloscyllium punctatum TaxID=137246 RepID=A0A401T5V2_CHIPU|nr:hypothetical protein [Chiloscyllium punctatum]
MLVVVVCVDRALPSARLEWRASGNYNPREALRPAREPLGGHSARLTWVGCWELLQHFAGISHRGIAGFDAVIPKSRYNGLVRWELQSDHENRVRYLLRFRARDHLLHLVKTQDLLTQTYSESHYLANGSTFLRNGGDLRKTQERLITLAHHVNQIYYKELNIQIFLVGIEIWTTRNKISSSQDTSKALLNFMKWRSKELLPRIHHDNAQLVSGMPFKESVGQAYLNAMCSEERSGGVVKDTWASTREVAKYIAHEIGHNLGMYHDEPSCQCPVTSGKCLLAESAVWMMNPVFSNCSIASLKQFLNHQNISCLMDRPNFSMNITVALFNDNIRRHYKISAVISVSLFFLVIAGLMMVIFQKQGQSVKAANPYQSSQSLLQQNTV